MTDNNSQSQDRSKQTDDVADLPVQEPTDAQAEEQAEGVRGGFSFVIRNNSSSPILS